MAEAAKRRAGKVESVPEPEDAGAGHEPDVCPVAWCPICLAVSSVQPLRPDVIEHLLKAGSELLLALRAVVDMRADEVAEQTSGAPGKKNAGGPTRLEKIDLA